MLERQEETDKCHDQLVADISPNKKALMAAVLYLYVYGFKVLFLHMQI